MNTAETPEAQARMREISCNSVKYSNTITTFSVIHNQLLSLREDVSSFIEPKTYVVG